MYVVYSRLSEHKAVLLSLVTKRERTESKYSGISCDMKRECKQECCKIVDV